MKTSHLRQRVYEFTRWIPSCGFCQYALLFCMLTKPRAFFASPTTIRFNEWIISIKVTSRKNKIPTGNKSSKGNYKYPSMLLCERYSVASAAVESGKLVSASMLRSHCRRNIYNYQKMRPLPRFRRCWYWTHGWGFCRCRDVLSLVTDILLLII